MGGLKKRGAAHDFDILMAWLSLVVQNLFRFRGGGLVNALTLIADVPCRRCPHVHVPYRPIERLRAWPELADNAMPR